MELAWLVATPGSEPVTARDERYPFAVSLGVWLSYQPGTPTEGHVGRPERNRSGGRVLARRAAVPLLTGLWLSLAAGFLASARGLQPPAGTPVPTVVLVAVFAATQAFVINVQLRREARSIFVSEVPTFLALMSLAPCLMVLTRVAGALIGFGALRRQYRQPQKLAFNLALAGAESSVAFTAFHLLLSPGMPPERQWLSAIVATGAASAFTAVGVGLVIELLEGVVQLRVLIRLAVEAAVQALPVAALGVVAWAAWQQNRWAALPLGMVTLVILFGYRAYAQLRERHLALERLYRFSQVLSGAPGVEDVLHRVLDQARDILHAERARVTFIPQADGDGVEVALEGQGPLRRGAPEYLNDADPMLARVMRQGQPIHIGRGTRDPVQRAWLERHDVRDSIMVPLQGETGPIGVLAVDDRLGDARGFEREDVRVLETVANQAAVALRNGELVDQLRHESLHDSLTGLPNRSHLQRDLDARLRDGTPTPFAVGILDLDSFKEVNDTLGHEQGDELLQEVARRMVIALRSRAVVCRLGGDEFAIIVDSCTTKEAAELVALRLHAALDAPVLLSGIEINVSGSLGIALAPQHGTAAGVLLRRADQAMYEAKHAGRTVRVFDDGLDTASPSKLALVAELRQAIAGGEIEVHVQPKVLAASGAVCGTEALVRWSTRARGHVPPSHFVPLAERSGLIHPLTQLVLDNAIAACAGWQRQMAGVGVSVNVSVRSLSDDSLVRLVDRLLRRHSLPPQLLTLEITESHIMADPPGTLHVLHQLRERGLGLSVDDFGTGYSSLSYLRRLPVQEVKIDRSFVHRMVHEPDDAAIVRSIVELARTLGLNVVAEGVEDTQTWEALKAMGVNDIQGWVIAKAMPVPELLQWARQHKDRTPAAIPS
jgi:diguanylate cyclase (GGDEF)-like protein